MPELAAQVRALRKSYGDVVAVDGLDLDVPRGGCFGLLGPNGAGKTTTVEVLEGLTAPDAGEVSVLGARWGRGEDDAIRRRIGVALQETRLPERLTVREVLRLFRSFYRHGRDVSEVLDVLGLGDKASAQVHQLSGGQRQRLALGCALVGQPDLLFLDEPTTGLDPQARRAVWDLVERFVGEGGTVLLTTHYMDEAERLCARIAVVDKGRSVALGSPKELLDLLPAPDRIELRADGHDIARCVEGLPEVRDVRRHDDTWVLGVTAAARTLPAVLSTLRADGIEPDAISTRRGTLDDVFLHLTGRELREL